jgi:hypothetical protein
VHWLHTLIFSDTARWCIGREIQRVTDKVCMCFCYFGRTHRADRSAQASSTFARVAKAWKLEQDIEAAERKQGGNRLDPKLTFGRMATEFYLPAAPARANTERSRRGNIKRIDREAPWFMALVGYQWPCLKTGFKAAMSSECRINKAPLHGQVFGGLHFLKPGNGSREFMRQRTLKV